jgi:hypothetical protein
MPQSERGHFQDGAQNGQSQYRDGYLQNDRLPGDRARDRVLEVSSFIWSRLVADRALR